MNKRVQTVLLACVLYVAGIAAAQAQLTVDITKGNSSPIPIAIVPFSGEGLAVDVAQVVEGDLARSGRFAPLARAAQPQQPTQASQIDWPQWKLVKTDYLAIGRIRADGAGYVIEVELHNVLSGERVLGVSVNATGSGLRLSAHRIADLLYEKLIGVPGAFATRIAYVAVEGPVAARHWRLVVADSDGENPVTIVDSKQPLMSPSWSPDGTQLAYVSFEGRVSSVFVQSIQTGVRDRVSGRAGINGAPAWAPDGRRMALALSQPDGNVDVFVLDLETKALLRVTDDPAIDTEPCFSADGQSLYFTSDRAGRPQIYQIRLAPGERAKRLTFEGSYNARPRLSPDGKMLAVVTQDQGAYRIARVDIATGQSLVLTTGRLDESPTFAPNGQTVIYSARERGRGVLATVAIDSGVVTRITLASGDIRDPAWSPRL
ncbi:MAG: Tol-Pal system beta propeller repeat protein TolB [Pseudomonadota bacterium]|jgi:TolB protein